MKKILVVVFAIVFAYPFTSCNNNREEKEMKVKFEKFIYVLSNFSDIYADSYQYEIFDAYRYSIASTLGEDMIEYEKELIDMAVLYEECNNSIFKIEQILPYADEYDVVYLKDSKERFEKYKEGLIKLLIEMKKEAAEKEKNADMHFV